MMTSSQNQDSFMDKDFIHKSIHFLQEFEWVYQFKMTEIIYPENIEKVPVDFLTFFQSLGFEDFKRVQKLIEEPDELKDQDSIAESKISSEWLGKTARFIEGWKDLRINFKVSEELKYSHNHSIPKKWSKKKFEEVSYLADFIKENCKLLECDAIVDIGSGLGYLSSHLADTCNLPVIAVESKQQMVKSASAEFNKLKPNQVKIQKDTKVHFVNLELNSSISTQLRPHLSKYSKVCITGLHACGDLTPWSLNLFLDDERYTFLGIVPCCYHKMNQGSFGNIPVSQVLRQELDNLEIGFRFVRNEAFCRIASQRSAEKFGYDLENETKHVFFRGLLELYAKQANLEIRRNRRKGLKGSLTSFDDYISKTIGPGGKFSLEGDLGLHKRNLEQLFIKNERFLKVVTGIIVMQGALQSVAENLILVDRLEFLHESGKVEALLKRVIPEQVSPRGIILSARKLDST